MFKFRSIAFSIVLIVLSTVCVPLASFASAKDAPITNYLLSTMDSILFWLQIAPEILNLILIVLSLYLMLDGVRRWGTNMSGAFSRSLIGLFILHTTSLEISFLPYLALFLEIWLCARGVQARTATRLKAEQATARKQVPKSSEDVPESSEDLRLERVA